MRKENIILKILTLGFLSLGYSQAQNNDDFYQVKARTNADSPNWKTYTAKTVDKCQKLSHYKLFRILKVLKDYCPMPSVIIKPIKYSASAFRFVRYN